eukprot:scaffold81723_cov40-Prasinocladus_malaysianus.AAC.1
MILAAMMVRRMRSDANHGMNVNNDNKKYFKNYEDQNDKHLFACELHQLDVSSLHLTFNSEKEWRQLAQLGYLPRVGIQYHWQNKGYTNFNDFLMDLKQSKRKSIRQ